MEGSEGVREYETRLGDLYRRGMRGRMGRVFSQYVAQFSEPDGQFDDLYLEGLFVTGTPPKPLRRRDRFRRLLQEFGRVLLLQGLVAECGCASGLSSFLLCSRLKQHDRSFDGTGYEVYDSFQGLSEPQPKDALEPGADELVAQSLVAGKFAFSIERVQQSLSGFPKVTYGPGWIPQAFPKDERQYRFVHVDVDLYQPTRDSLEYFWPRLVPGGVLVCDDYNWSGAKRAVEEFAAESRAKFSVTPHTQAVIVR